MLGVAYSAIVVRRALGQREYRPVFEDWLWHTFLPALAYAALLVAGTVLGRNVADALLVIGAAALLLVFVGIHNAWDTVTFMMTRRGVGQQEAEAGAGRAAATRAGVEATRGSGPGGPSTPGATSAGQEPT